MIEGIVIIARKQVISQHEEWVGVSESHVRVQQNQFLVFMLIDQYGATVEYGSTYVPYSFRKCVLRFTQFAH